MGKQTTSTTSRDSNIVERLGGRDHSVTTISDGDKSVSKAGNTARESEERASKAWRDKK